MSDGLEVSGIGSVRVLKEMRRDRAEWIELAKSRGHRFADPGNKEAAELALAMWAYTAGWYAGWDAGQSPGGAAPDAETK